MVFISIIFVKDSIILRCHTIAVCEILRWAPVCADREMGTNASFWIKLLNKGIKKLLESNWTSLNMEGKTHSQNFTRGKSSQNKSYETFKAKAQDHNTMTYL